MVVLPCPASARRSPNFFSPLRLHNHALEWRDWVALIGAERPTGLIEEMELITASP